MHLTRPLLLSTLATAALLPPPSPSPSPSPAPPPSTLTPRVLLSSSPYGPNWHQYLDALSPIYPNPPACTLFAQFYTIVLEKLSPGGPWAHLPELSSFVIGYGNVRLDFLSTVGPVPWSVVRDFAGVMAAHSRRGFAGRYRYVYMHAATGMAVTVLLSVGGG